MHRLYSARRKGFTVIEALTVIVLIGIALAIAMPAVGRTIAASRVQRASAAVANDIKTAFALSAKQRRPVRLEVDGAARSVRVRSRAGATLRETWYDGSSDLVLSSLSASPATIEVYPSGLASGNITITMEATPSFRRQIAATRAGQVRITVP